MKLRNSEVKEAMVVNCWRLKLKQTNELLSHPLIYIEAKNMVSVNFGMYKSYVGSKKGILNELLND